MKKKYNFPPRLIAAVKTGTVIPFIGAGISKKAVPSKFPTWVELARNLNDEIYTNNFIQKPAYYQISSLINENKYLLAIEAIKSSTPDDFYKTYLEANFLYDDQATIDLTTQILILKMSRKIVLTTNFDRLLEDAYAKTFRRAPSTSTFRDPYRIQATLQNNSISQTPTIFKLHGDISDITSLILSERDYRIILFDHQAYESVLTSIFMNYVVLFLGFSLSDKEIMLHLEKMRHHMNYFSQPNFAFIPNNSVSEVEEKLFRQNYGIQIIRYSPNNNHLELDTLLRSLMGSTKSR